MKTKLSYFLLLNLVLCFQTYAQRKETSAGDLLFEEFAFEEAIINYESALLKNPSDTIYIYRQLAKCNLYSFKYVRAEFYLEKVMASENPTNEDYLDYGTALKLNGKYEKASEMFRIYSARSGGEDPRAKLQSKSIAWAIKTANVIKPVTITTTNLDVSGQSLGYTLFDNGIIYAHARNKPKEGLTSVFDLDFAYLKDTVHFEGSAPVVQLIKMEANEGAPSINKDAGLLYFYANQTNVKKKKGKTETSDEGVSNFKIYVAENVNGQFKNTAELPFNDKNYNCIHPAISEDGEHLYFASDMPGGFGGLDLYVVKRNDRGGWGKPENLGSDVNTIANEMFPFVLKNRIYFASKGHIGYGGYDLYTAQLNYNGMPSNIQNMGQPINSFRDDVAMYVYDDGRLGYFSSNRESDNGEDKVYFFHDHTLDVIPVPINVNPVVKAEVKKDTLIAQQIPQDTVAKVELIAFTEPIMAIESRVRPTVIPRVTKELIEKVKVVAQETKEEVLLTKIFPHVHFNLNQFEVGTDFSTILDTVIRAYKMSNKVRIQIHGYADSRGSAAYNKQLSQKRANQVRNYLLNHGVSKKRIVCEGLGETELLNQCSDDVVCSEEEHAKNRRVEIRLVR